MTKFFLPLFLIAAVGLQAAAAKTYQVTGNVTALTDTMITLMKADEKFEIARGSAKVDGKLAVGARVTVHYSMTAASIEVKAPAVDGSSKDAAKAATKADAAADKAAKKARKQQ